MPPGFYPKHWLRCYANRMQTRSIFILLGLLAAAGALAEAYKWTDENGGDDVVYQNGAPVVNVNVTTKGDSSDDKAMTLEILKMLATGQVNTNEAIARLSGDTPSTEEEEVIQEPAPAVKPKTTNQKRSIGKRPTN